MKGLRDPLPIAGLGNPAVGRRLGRRPGRTQRGRWCWRSDVVQHRPCRTIRGFLFTTRSRHRPTTSLFTEDIAMTSAVLVLALSVSGQSQQAWPAAQGPGKVLPQAQAPSKIAPAPQAPRRSPRRPRPRRRSPGAAGPGQDRAPVAPQAPAKSTIARRPRPRPSTDRRRPRPRRRSPRPRPREDRAGAPGSGQVCSGRRPPGRRPSMHRSPLLPRPRRS